MSGHVRSVVDSPRFGLTGLVVGLVSIAVGVVVAIRYGMRRQLSYRIRSRVLVRGGIVALPGVEIRYRGYGRPVEDLTVSRVLIWYSGRGVILRGDVLVKDALKVAIEPGRVILSAEVVQQANRDNRLEATLRQDRSAATVRFAFIRPRNGWTSRSSTPAARAGT